MQPVAPSLRNWGALLVAVTAIVVFAPTLANGFAYDDVALVAGDPRVQTFDMGAILTRGYWGDDALGLYRPITTLSFAFDWSIASGSPTWFHLTNTLLNAVASVLVFLLLMRWFGLAPALGGALLFAVHPVHVEAVANVVGRAELMAAIGVLGALLVRTRPDRNRPLPMLAAAALFALGLGSKESAVVLLPLLVLVDIADQRLHVRSPSPWLRDNAVALTTLILTFAAWFALRAAILGGGLAPARVDAAFDLASTTPARILTALQAWPVWANLLFAPVTLLADYGPRTLMPIDAWNALAIAGGFVAIAVIASGVTSALHGRGLLALALLWFPVAILPVSNLLFATGVIVAERTLYLPSVAVSFALAFAIRHGSAFYETRPQVARAAVALLATVLLLLSARSIVRIPAWKSTESTFAALVEDRPDSFRGQWALARIARNQQEMTEARRRYDLALALWPFRHRLVIEAAMFAGETGDLDRARTLAAHAVELRPDDLDSIRFLAGVALDLGDTRVAASAIRQGLDLHPDDETLLRMRDALAGLNLESE